jgi:hypothetical protein
MRPLSRAREDGRNFCDLCGQPGWRNNPVTVRAGERPMHMLCRERAEKKGARA